VSSSRSAGPGRSLRTLPSLLITAFRLVWTASRARTLLLLGVQVTSALSLFASVLVVDQALDAVLQMGSGDASLGSAVLPIVLLAVLIGLTTLFSAVGTLEERVLGEMVERAVWRDVLHVCQAVDLRAFDDPEFYDQASRVEENAAWRTRHVVRTLVNLAGDVLGVVAATVGLLAIAPLLAPPLLLSGVPLLFASRLAGRREFAFSVQQQPRHRHRDYLQDVLTHRAEAKEVRAFSLSARLGQHWEANYAAYLSDLNRHVRHLIRLSLAGGLGSALLTAGALLLALLLVARGDLDVAAAGAAVVAVRLLGGRVSSASRGLSALLEASLFLQDLQEFSRRVGAGTNIPSISLPAAPDRFREVAVDGVSFTYPDAESPALSKVSLRIHRGEVVALVGENGSGKTTLAKLLANLFVPDGGAILWDGADLRQYDADSVRRRIAVLFQDFVRYQFTAHVNIGLGRADEELDETTVRDAALRADADGFLTALPAGYQTMLSKEYVGGTDLSMGQWQRVALARAFVRDAPLVILDEPSASLDPRAEYDLFERIRALFTGRTVVVISHRFSTVRSADRIYVLANGSVIEEGNHDELMDRHGVYAELFELQASAYMAPDLRRDGGDG
jgi:ATP-binding cassette subfamily B protein